MTINYDFDAIGALSGGIGGTVQQLQMQSAGLRKLVESLDESVFKGAGKAAFLDAHNQLDRILATSTDQLDGLGHGVQKAANNMADTDQGVARSFGI